MPARFITSWSIANAQALSAELSHTATVAPSIEGLLSCHTPANGREMGASSHSTAMG